MAITQNLPSFTPSLEFHLTLPEKATPNLLEGYLLFKYEPNSAGIKLLATSGCRNNQFQKSWLLKGRGCLPPSDAIAPKVYTVSTQRLWMPQTKGVEGSFYAISPFQVIVKGIARGDFGVHFDANVPGSAGCCVIRSQEHWDIFRKAIAELREKGHQQIAFTVSYHPTQTLVA